MNPISSHFLIVFLGPFLFENEFIFSKNFNIFGKEWTFGFPKMVNSHIFTV